MRKKILSMVMAVCMLCAFVPAVHASEIVDSGKCGDNLTWTLDDRGKLIISGNGEMIGWYGNHSDEWFKSRISIKEIEINDGITNIGGYAFA